MLANDWPENGGDMCDLEIKRQGLKYFCDAQKFPLIKMSVVTRKKYLAQKRIDKKRHVDSMKK